MELFSSSESTWLRLAPHFAPKPGTMARRQQEELRRREAEKTPLDERAGREVRRAMKC